MRNCKLALATLSTLFAFAGTASAADALRGSIAPSNSMYVGVSAGLSLMPAGDMAGRQGAAYIGLTDVIEYDTGFNFSAYAGKRITENIRVQADIGYIASAFKKTNGDFFLGYGAKATDGELYGLYAAGSIYFDAPLTESITPYLGVGGGFFAPNVNDLVLDDSGTEISYPLKAKDAIVPLIKLSAGVAYKVSDAMSVTADYSYLQSADFDIENGPDPDAPTLTSDLSSHTVGVGLRYDF